MSYVYEITLFYATGNAVHTVVQQFTYGTNVEDDDTSPLEENHFLTMASRVLDRQRKHFQDQCPYEYAIVKGPTRICLFASEERLLGHFGRDFEYQTAFTTMISRLYWNMSNECHSI